MLAFPFLILWSTKWKCVVLILLAWISEWTNLVCEKRYTISSLILCVATTDNFRTKQDSEDVQDRDKD